MRASTLVLATILASAPISVLAQAVIDVDGQKAVPAQGQGQAQPQAPAQAQENSQPPLPSRYLIRVDALEREIAALRNEIASLRRLDGDVARLQDEVASLKKEIAGLKEPRPPRSRADLTQPSDKGADVSVRLPTHQDILRARDYLEDAWRRLVEMIISMQKDIMRRG